MAERTPRWWWRRSAQHVKDGCDCGIDLRKPTDKIQFRIYPLRSTMMGKRKWLSVNGCIANAPHYRSHPGPFASNPQPRTKLLQDPLQSRATTFLLQWLQRFLSSGMWRRASFGGTPVYVTREAQYAWPLTTNRSPRLSDHTASHPRQWPQCHTCLPRSRFRSGCPV